jgi:hypothetical protein
MEGIQTRENQIGNMFSETKNGIRCWLETSSALDAKDNLEAIQHFVGGEIRGVELPEKEITPNVGDWTTEDGTGTMITYRLFDADPTKLNAINQLIKLAGDNWSDALESLRVLADR